MALTTRKNTEVVDLENDRKTDHIKYSPRSGRFR